MAGIKVSPTVLAWGLAVAGAGILFVGGGCRLIVRAIEAPGRIRERWEERHRPPIDQSPNSGPAVSFAEPRADTPLPEVGPNPVPLPKP